MPGTRSGLIRTDLRAFLRLARQAYTQELATHYRAARRERAGRAITQRNRREWSYVTVVADLACELLMVQPELVCTGGAGPQPWSDYE